MGIIMTVLEGIAYALLFSVVGFGWYYPKQYLICSLGFCAIGGTIFGVAFMNDIWRIWHGQ